MRFALILLCFGLLPTAAWADEVCLSRATALVPAQAAGQPIGQLDAGRCYAVQDRADSTTRIYISGPAGFRGEADVPNDALLQILVDDVDIGVDGGVWGKVLSGTPVSIMQRMSDGRLVVQPVEGRFRPRMTVGETAIFPAESLPEPDPEDVADPPWPVGDLPLPPSATALTSRPGGGTILAEIGAPTMGVRALRWDPALGQLRMAVVEQTEFEVKLRVVAPTMWVEGWTTDLAWREPPPEAGHDPSKGAPSPRGRATPPRQVGTKDVNLSLEAKGDPIGLLGAGTRVEVLSEDKGWAHVKAQGAGSSAEGWMDRRKLLKEGAEEAIAVEFSPVVVVSVGNTAVSWADATGHSRPVEEGEEPDDDELVLVADPVRGAVLREVARWRLAYGRAALKTPGTAGELTLRVRVGADGQIVESVLAVDTLGLPEVADGVLASVAALEFPERKIPRKKKRSDPDLDWNVDLWVQLVFKTLP